MSAFEVREYRLQDVSVNFDSLRRPVKGTERRAGQYPYYGASGVVDFVDAYLYEGLYLLVAEDGENLRTRKTPVAFLADGRFWVNNHAHVLQGNEHADTRFLAHAIEQIDISGYLTGSTQPKLTKSALESIKLALPPVAEQTAIADLLAALDEKIAVNTTLANVADACASSVLMGSLSSDRVRLDSVARITMGSSPRGETLNELGFGVPFYQGVRDYGFRTPTRRVFTTSPVRTAEAGDILVSVRAPVGAVNVAQESLCIGRGLAAVRSTVDAQATLFHQLKTERDIWKPFEAEGTVFGSINRDQLHAVQVRSIRPERVRYIEDELTALESVIAVTLSENRTLAATRDALLPQLMSGKLRVRDAEAIVADAGA
ncbi:restriction endonuclease subunit S [Microbacterium sp. T32]|uniref:restriction endonuclease subunit S n=1 Tax=Microbacterium sp. T32 TaxID=1776083 RepID=UPI0007AB5514|nr:restriction endonuclease subunit S [Microbacterium sp. T32]KZE42748.1 hypothetical protein AVW09_08910 [Microbacterium sp. T32]